MTFVFNEEQKILIAEYRKILVYGYEMLSSVTLNLEKDRVRKRVVYFMMGAMQSYSESQFKLLSSEPAYEKPGESLLRSQLEIWLNLRYIYSSRSEERARFFMSDLIMESVKFARKHQALWIKYPNWNLKFGKVESPNDWDKFIADNVNFLIKYRRKYGDNHVMKLPSLEARAIAIDEHLKILGILSERTSAQKYYTLFYPYFSQSAHSTMPGLQRYMRGTTLSPEPYIDIDSKPEDAERVLTISYAAYFDVLRFFLKVFGKYDPTEYRQFKQYSNKLMKMSVRR